MNEQACGTVRYAGMGHEDSLDAIANLGVEGLSVLWLVARDGPLSARADEFAIAAPLFDACHLPAGHDGPHEYAADQFEEMLPLDQQLRAAGAPQLPGLD